MDNHDEINSKLGAIEQWQKDHQHADKNAFNEINGRLDLQDSNISLLPTKEEMEEITKKVMLEVLFKTGKFTKTGIITLASIIVALTVISGAWKGVLAFLGIGFISK